ncbi:spermidine/putrescine ABC transporter substrate-binding protein [Sorangium cellulosum]|uniref:Spermidine/putrescine ABC transporter substrate-binding protein n=1 Tax=Sorangium cellulosum TaxID=56 RepID=A0A2L0FB29_SORCE|nr:extracellular solute-binding protein [Sorangium cellulosum]AUX48790.1 spermidine/putrescine ABC transporter substrate-binding protein [Sorangium cellulosum]
MIKDATSLISVLVLALSGLSSAGCGRDGGQAKPEGDANAEGQAASQAASKELFLYIFSDYYPTELMKKFEAETGIRITIDVYDSNETMLAKLQAGGTGYDVVVPSDYMVKTMIDVGLAEKIDVYAMENFKNIKAPLAAPDFDPKREYSGPYMVGLTGFTYDSARVPGGTMEESWRSILDPAPELKGQIGMLDDEIDVWNAAAYYLGFDKCTEKPEDAEKILALLQKQKPSVAVYKSDGALERMTSKEVMMHMQWNGQAHRVKQKLTSVVFVYPKEGLSFWNDNLVVPKGAKNKQNARTFINWMMTPENAAAASNFTGYMNSIEGSEKFLRPELRDDPAVVMPEQYKDRLRPGKVCSAATRKLRSKVWTRLRK